MSDTDNRLSNGLTYADAGVDIDAGEMLVEHIKPLAKSTARPGSEPSLGGFGALFDLKAAGFTDPLIVTTTVGIGSTWLSSRLDEFLKLYPLIQLEIRLNDAELDLAMREADVAIRLHRPNQSEMIQRKLFTVHNHFYASNAYIDELGMPGSADQLDSHRIISFGEPVPSYLGDINYLERMGRTDSSPRRAALKVNAIYGMMQACRAGIGIAMLPDYVTESETQVKRVLTGVELPAYEAFFVYPPALKNSKRVGVFRDFLVGKAREWSF